MEEKSEANQDTSWEAALTLNRQNVMQLYTVKSSISLTLLSVRLWQLN